MVVNEMFCQLQFQIQKIGEVRILKSVASMKVTVETKGLLKSVAGARMLVHN